MGPYGPYGRPEVKKQRENVKILISDGDFFLVLCPGDFLALL